MKIRGARYTKVRTTVNIQNFGAAKFRHFTIFDISAAIYFRRGVEGMIVRQMLWKISSAFWVGAEYNRN